MRRQFISAAVMLLLMFASSMADPVSKKVTPTYITAPLLWPQPSQPDAKPKTQSVPVFPGVMFYSTFCGGPNVDRQAVVSKSSITYSQNRGPSGNSMKIQYFFSNAKLEVTITETFKNTVLAKNVAVLSSLLDKASDKQIQVYTASERKAAAAAITTLVTHLDKFTVPNQEAACMAFLTGPAKNPIQPYSPALANTIKYLNKIKTSLTAFS